MDETKLSLFPEEELAGLDPEIRKLLDETQDTPAQIPEAPEETPEIPVKNPEKRRSWKMNKILAICLPLAAVLAILIGILIGRAMDPYDCRIVSNVSIAGVDVSGMTKVEARKALESALEQSLYAKELSVALPEETIVLSPSEAKLKVNVRKAVNEAYRIGRKTEAEAAQDVDILPYLKLDEDLLLNLLKDYATRHNTDLSETSYTMNGTMPELAADKVDTAAPCQNLMLTLGQPTLRVAVEEIFSSILAEYGQAVSACADNTYGLTLDTPAEILPQEPDLEALYNEFRIDPVDDSLDMDTYQQVPGAYGYHFDLEAARELVKNAEYGETITIPMEYVEPEILGDEVYFRDVLGSCETKHTDNENRNNNLQLVCQALDGLILQPGEEFSYNDSVGERTKERGYKPAGAYSGTVLVNSIGGGVCQGSTTLYNCVLLADLEVVFRINHGYAVNYVPYGLDATVNWGGPDFKFRNSSHFPIMIKAELSDGYMKMQILGTDEKDYYVKMESTVGWGDMIYVQSYKCKYDKETDELISREKEARSHYMIG